MPSLSRIGCARNGVTTARSGRSNGVPSGGRSGRPATSGAFLAPVQSRHQVRLAAAQSKLLRQLAGIGAATGGVDCQIEGLHRAAKFDLIHAVGLDDRVVNPHTITASIWTRGALRMMPPTVMGVPADVAALAD